MMRKTIHQQVVDRCVEQAASHFDSPDLITIGDIINDIYKEDLAVTMEVTIRRAVESYKNIIGDTHE